MNIACIVVLLFQEVTRESIVMYAFFLVYMSFVLIYGFMVNSFADLDEDRLAGKNRGFLDQSRGPKYLFLLLSGSFIILYPAFQEPTLFIIGLLVFLLATFYSVRPIRFKERGLIGIIISAISVGPFPFLIFLLGIKASPLLSCFLVFWLFLAAFISDLIHQIEDYNNDRKTRTDTWVQRIGLKKSKLFLKYSLFLLFVFCILAPFIFTFHKGLLISGVLLVVSLQNFMEDLLTLAE
ncbi:MAG: UbiA family prenyltransferase [Bacteroidota bacterium]